MPYPRPLLILAVVGALGLWAFVIAHLVVAAISLRTLCSKDCVRAWARIFRQPTPSPVTGWDEWAARSISAFLIVGGLSIGYRGLIYMAETSHYLYELMSAP
jgi:hypothetical protein